MKKTFITYCIACMILALSAVSCYEDKSTYGTISDTVVIDATGFGPRIEVANGSTLRLSPKVTPANDPDLTYEWKITITPGGTETTFSKLSEEKDLERVMTQAPSERPYRLVFTVTNKRTGVQYMHCYHVYVISRMGDGVLVADTKDGQTSDISLVRNKYVSAGYTGETQYIRDSYSFTNGQKMEGVMRKMIYGPIGLSAQTFYVTAMTDKTLENLDASTHGIVQNFDQMFTFAPEKDKEFQTLGANNFSVFFVYGGDIYAYGRQLNSTTQTFSDPLNYVSPAQIANKKFANEYFQVNADSGNAFFFDETKGTFYHMEAPSYSITPLTAGTSASVNFDPNTLAGYTLLGSCRGEQVASNPVHIRVHFILKDPQGSIDVYRLSYRYDPNADGGSYFYESEGKFSTATCPDIANALCFEGSYKRSVIYYATKSKVYPCVIGGSAVGVNEGGAFTAPAGEEITAMSLFREAWSYYTQPGSDMAVMPEDANQLLVATYNDNTQEGKVYVLPITGNSGSLGAADADHTFTGFGRITALGTQGKQ